ncbi:MAG: Lrp/AsnC family transcriptional regulator [Burkholderiaceae bacterium]|nr:Lrp/AsnC family transcriptional regulator [Burkholderiaceae bacterium]
MDSSSATPVTFDATDLRLLALLQDDAGLSNQDLAARAHVSPATCMRRVKRLVETGVVKRRVALLEPALLGPTLEAVCEVMLDRQGVEYVDAYEALAVAHPAVAQCYRVSPGPDLVLIARVRNMQDWVTVAGELFTQQANVRNVKTYFVMQRGKFETAWPLPPEAG